MADGLIGRDNHTFDRRKCILPHEFANLDDFLLVGRCWRCVAIVVAVVRIGICRNPVIHDDEGCACELNQSHFVELWGYCVAGVSESKRFSVLGVGCRCSLQEKSVTDPEYILCGVWHLRLAHA